MRLKTHLMRLQRIKTARAALLAIGEDINASPPWLMVALRALDAMQRATRAEAIEALPLDPQIEKLLR